ncbi:hypothetical protein JXR93_09485, partial [bacterium]|nr:hypothetical protein [bacterium]
KNNLIYTIPCFIYEVILNIKLTPKVKIAIAVVFYTGMVIYMGFRIFITFKTLGKYGVNPYIFGFIDIVTVIPYAIGAPKIIYHVKNRNKNRIVQWLIIFAFSFIAPYIYIGISGKGIPLFIWGILAAIILTLGSQAFLSLYLKIKKVLKEDSQN